MDNDAYSALMRGPEEWQRWVKNNKDQILFDGVDLSGAIFTNIKNENLKGVYLPGANLYGVKLNGVNLSDSDLSGVKQEKVGFGDKEILHLNGANLSNANLENADLTGAYLNGADLTGAILKSAIIKEAILTGARITDWKNEGAVLDKVKCDYVYLKQNNQECCPLKRCPPNSNFSAGEFSKLGGDLNQLKSILVTKRKSKREIFQGNNEPLREEINTILNPECIDKAKKETEYLELRVKSLGLQNKLTLLERKIGFTKEGILYILVALIFVTFTFLLFERLSEEQISISVDYDVGTIIGGVLVGGSAILAATSYARRSQNHRGENRR